MREARRKRGRVTCCGSRKQGRRACSFGSTFNKGHACPPKQLTLLRRPPRLSAFSLADAATATTTITTVSPPPSTHTQLEMADRNSAGVAMCRYLRPGRSTAGTAAEDRVSVPNPVSTDTSRNPPEGTAFVANAQSSPLHSLDPARPNSDPTSPPALPSLSCRPALLPPFRPLQGPAVPHLHAPATISGCWCSSMSRRSAWLQNSAMGMQAAQQISSARCRMRPSMG